MSGPLLLRSKSDTLCCVRCQGQIHVTCLCNGWGVWRTKWDASLQGLAAAATVAVELLERDGHDAESDALADAVRAFVMGHPFKVQAR